MLKRHINMLCVCSKNRKGHQGGDHGNCNPYVKSWQSWDNGLSGKIVVHSKDDEARSTWSATLVFEKEIEKFTSYDGTVDVETGKVFKVSPKDWNAECKKGTERTFGFQLKFKLNSPKPRLNSLTVNGVPMTCREPDDSTSTTNTEDDTSEEESENNEEEEQNGNDETTTQGTATQGTTTDAGADRKRGVFVPWPKKVMGIYILLADDDHEGFESNAVWSPKLYEYQQKAANVLFFTFIHPVTMDVPPSFQNLAKSRGTNEPGAVPANTVILFAIGGYAYSVKIKPWPWLESKAAAEAMAKKVADWPNLYGCDGIDLDLEDGAGDTASAGPNMIHFVRKLRELSPTMIIGQPTYGFPQVKAEIAVINASWDEKGRYKNLADSIGLMVYEGTNALNYVKNYVNGSGQWSGFPIKCNAPSNTILLGAKGSASPTTIRLLANAVIKNDYLGIMVWYASVENGFQYAVSWDTSNVKASQQGYQDALAKMKAVI